MNGFYRQRFDEPSNCDQRNRKRGMGYYCREMMVVERTAVVVIGNPAAIGIGEPVAAKEHCMRRTLRRQEERFRDMESEVLDKEE